MENKNIWLLPTNKPSRLSNCYDNKLHLDDVRYLKDYLNIYITNDEEIKYDEYYLGDDNNIYCLVTTVNYNGKKIILTTDQDLIKDGVQAIDDEFLEWFVKNPSCEEVKVKHKDVVQYGNMTMYDHNGDGSYYFCKDCEVETSRSKEELLKFGVEYYKIIIPKEPRKIDNCYNFDKEIGCIQKDCRCEKEEPKQEIVGYRLKPFIDRMIVDGVLKNTMPIWNDADKSVYFIRGHVAGSLVAKMRELQVLDLWFTPIYESKEVKSDWVKDNHLEYYNKEGIMINEPKQETLEEVAEKYIKKQDYTSLEIDDKIFEAILFGATWEKEQNKNLYTEEEVKSMIDELIRDCYFLQEPNQNVNAWFEQFKKK